MVKLTRIYTRGGDCGKTSLGTGKRLLKSSLRIEAIGAVDEANAAIGWVRQFSPLPVDQLLSHIQNDLFDLGADLCMPEEDRSLSQETLRITADQVTFLEQEIDQINRNLPPLTSFILPGGSPASAALHMARTIVRRSERSLVALAQSCQINPEAIKYINRLSDLLFVLCRHLNDQGKQDVLWVPGKHRHKDTL